MIISKKLKNKPRVKSKITLLSFKLKSNKIEYTEVKAFTTTSKSGSFYSPS